MKHVIDTTISMGLNYVPIPPHEQSLNLAEKAIDLMWQAGAASLVDSRIKDKFYPQAVDCACYTHMRMATTLERDYRTPYETITGSTPSVSHLRPFGRVCYVAIPKSKRAKIRKKSQGGLQRGDIGVFIGYHSMFTNTYRVLTSGEDIIHTRSCKFDFNAVISQQPSLAKLSSDSYPQGGATEQQAVVNLEAIHQLHGVPSEEAAQPLSPPDESGDSGANWPHRHVPDDSLNESIGVESNPLNNAPDNSPQDSPAPCVWDDAHAYA